MVQNSAGSVPIPPPRKDDTEDVAWALSTAEAMYARGDRSDALKWLRRAAESASEAEADDRALELAKAAADLAALVGPTSMMPPPPPPPPLPRPSAAPPAVRVSSPPAAMHPPAPPPAARPSASPPPPPASRPTPIVRQPTPMPMPAATLGQAPRAAALPPQGVTPVAARTAEGRRTRRSRPDIQIARPPDEATQTRQDMALPLTPSRRRGRSRPDPQEMAPPPPEPEAPEEPARLADEVTPMAPPLMPAAVPTPRPTPRPAPSDSGEMHGGDPDAWPTASLGHYQDDPQEKTRIGVPAYEASAKMASVPPEAPSTPALDEAPVRPAQAIRVVVWRAADGVRIAPQGTRVAAITIDAVLVGLDPEADLVAWLSGK